MQTDTSVLKLDINLIIPNKYQPRKVFEDSALNTLAESIKNYGIINPILVRKKEDKYEIIAGERRFRAAKKLGLTEVPVIIKSANEQQMAELALIENLERQGLNPVEEAKSYEEIMKIGNYTQVSLAEKLGKSQSSIANKIRLLSLPIEIQEALSNKKISERHARSLISIEDKEKQLELLDKIIKEKLTVKETEGIIKSQEITDEEINQAINDIMKTLNQLEEETDVSKEEEKKDEKEDDNMNNGNFFPNYDNNNAANNNASLNMMNMQSMNQAPMAPVPEMVMPTMETPIQEPQLVVPTQPVDMQPQMITPEIPVMPMENVPNLNQFGPAPIQDLNVNINPVINPMEGFMNLQEPQLVVPTQPVDMQSQMITPEVSAMPIDNAPILNQFGPVPMAEPVIEQPQLVVPEAPATVSPMIDAPLFNPEVVIPTVETTMPVSATPEVPTMAPASFEIPVMPIDSIPTQDKLSELQVLLSSKGFEFKTYSNDTTNCVIVELPKN